MRRDLVVFVTVVCMVFGLMSIILPDTGYAKSMLLTDADNKVCPVTGETITKKKYNTGYNGRRYWFSSYDAVLEFKKNPGKYADDLDSGKQSSRGTSRNTRKSWY